MFKPLQTKIKFAAIGAFLVTLICCAAIAFAGLTAAPSTAKADTGVSAQSNAELAAAWNNAVQESIDGNGKQVTFTLTEDWTAAADSNYSTSFGAGTGFYAGTIYVRQGANIVLDLNGHTIDRALSSTVSEGYVIHVAGTLEIVDTSAGGSGKITGGYDDDYGGGIYIDHGALTITGGTISGNHADYDGGAVYSYGGTITMTGGTITGNTAGQHAGGVSLDGSTLNLSGTAIIADNSANSNGGGIYVWYDGTIDITGGTISNNTARLDGGGIYFYGPNDVTIKGGNISGNTAGQSGGGIYCDADANLTMTSGTVSNNTARFGGGLYVYDNFTMSGGTISDNKAERQGAAVYFDTNGRFLRSGGTISDNVGSVAVHFDMETSGETKWGHIVQYSIDWGEKVECSIIDDWTAEDGVAGFGTGTGFHNGRLHVPTGANIILDLSGHTINRNLAGKEAIARGNVMLVNGNLEIIDDSVNKTGKITGGNTNSISGGAIHVYHGNLTLISGSITNNTANYGGGVYVQDGTFTMTGGKIDNNSAMRGAGVCVSPNAKFAMNGGTITGNTATSDGGGVYVHSGGNFTMNGGTISENNSRWGAGVYVVNGMCEINDGEISGNTASSNGGGVWVNCNNGNNGTLIMNGGKITNNTASSNGGGVYVADNSTFEMNGGEISDNTTNTDGGGLVVKNDSTFLMTAGTISNNTSTLSGGGVYVANNSKFIMNDGELSTNNASTNGGGVYVDGGCAFTMNGGTISGNTAQDGGGGVGVYNGGSTFEMTDGDISNNSATNGGGVHVNSGTFEMLDGVITGNTASGRGGAVYSNSSFTMTGGTITQNKAPSIDGGGVYVTNGSKFTMNGGTISENNSWWGAGVYVANGTFEINDGIISGNIVGSHGGGVLVAESGTFIMNGGLIRNNQVRNNGDVVRGGGGIEVDGGTFTMNGGEINGNFSAASGGGIYLIDGAVYLNGGTISDNTASISGGGIYVHNSGSFNLGGGIVTDNTVGGNADNIYLQGESLIFVSRKLKDYGKSATHIGVTLESTTGTFTSGYTSVGNSSTNYGTFFFSDSNHALGIVSGEVEVQSGTASPKTHLTWQYGIVGGQMTAMSASAYYSVEFDGNAYTVTPQGENVKYAVDEYGNVATTFFAVGKYYITAANSANYTNPTFTFEILPGSIENAEIKYAGSYIYNGAEITPDITVFLYGAALVEGVDYTVSYSDNVNAGTAKITVQGIGNYYGTALGSFTIEKRNVSVRWGDTQVEYNGAEQAIKAVVEGVLDGDEVKLNVSYLKDGVTALPVNIGEYTAVATLVADNYQLIGDLNCAFTVNAKAVAVIWSSDKFEYNGEEQVPAAYYYDLDGNKVDIPAEDVTAPETSVDVGEYTVTVTGNTYGNYKTVTTNHVYKIVKVSVSIDWDNAALTYDGDAKEPLFTLNGVLGEDLSAQVTLTYYKNGEELDGAPVDAGKYVVKATLDSDNYNLEVASYEFTVNAAEMTITSNYDDETFTGEGKAPEITASLNGEELDVTVTYAKAGSDEFSEELPVNAGSYVAKIVEESGNFEEATLTFEIKAKSVEVVWSLDENSVLAGTTYEWSYDGKKHAPVAKAVFSFNGVETELELDVDGRSAVGRGTVSATLKDTDFNKNFTLTNTTVNVEIVASLITEVRWYAYGSDTPFEDGESPSFTWISVYGKDGPKLSAYGVVYLDGVNEAGESIKVTTLYPLDVNYPSYHDGFWWTGKELSTPYTAEAKLADAGSNCTMSTSAKYTTLSFYVTDLTADESYADVRWVVEVDGVLVDANGYEFTYNGALQAPKAIVVLDAEKFAADPSDTSSFEYLKVGGAKTNVGTYYAYLLSGDYEIAPEDSEFRFTIKPLDVTISWTVGVYTYNGTAQAPVATVGGTGGVPCTVTVQGFVNAGTHTAKAVVSKNFNIVSGETQEFNIAKFALDATDVVWKLEGASERDYAYFVLTFDGEMHTPTATLKAIINNKQVEITLAVSGGASTVGTHYAYAILSNTDAVNSNYTFAGSSARFDIVNSVITRIYWEDGEGNTITVADQVLNFTYDGTPKLPKAYYLSGPDGNTPVYLNVIGERTEAGTYVAYVTDDLDFAVSTKHTFVINPAQLNVTWTNTEFNYMPNAKEQKPTVSFTDADGNEVVLVEGLDYTVTGFKNAGEYTSEIFFLNANYTANNPTCEITIKPAEVTVNWLGNDNGTFVWEYDGGIHAPTANANGLTVTVIGGESAVGVYTAVAGCDNENYVLTNPTHEFEIAPYAITVVWNVGDYTYDGESYFVPTASYVDWNGDEQDLEVKGGRMDAGEYTAEAILPENCTFKFVSGENAGTHKFEIKHLLLTDIVWEGNEDGTFVWTFNGEPHHPTAYYVDENGDRHELPVTGTAVNAGTYTATAKPANAKNFAFAEDAEVNKEFTIKPATVIVKWLDDNGDEQTSFTWNYDGGLHAPVAKFEDVDGNLVTVPVSGATANSGEHTATAIDVFVNYDFEKYTDTQNFSITGKEVTAVWSVGADGSFNEDDGVYEYEFNGKAHLPTASAEGVEFAYTVRNADGAVVSSAINAGEYTVTVVATNFNYKITEESKTVKLVIKPKTVTVQWGNASLSYTGEAQAPEAWFVDVNGQKVKLSVSGAETEAGENYTATASFAKDTDNYVLDGATCPFTIAAKDGDEWTWDWENGEWKVVTDEPESPDPEEPDGTEEP